MKYISVSEFAEKWCLKETSVTYYCRAGKVSGAVKNGKSWSIPEGSPLPQDGRKNDTVSNDSHLPLPIGVSDYKEAVSKYYYVDKTLMIKEIIDNLPKVSLFTRPRRFGKTLNMDMLRVYFEKSDEDTSVYFKEMAIWQQGEKYQSFQGKYPVIFLSFKDVKYSSFTDALEKIRDLFQSEFLRHAEIIKNTELFADAEINFYNGIINKTATTVELSAALHKLSKMLCAYYKTAPVIIIDEYDTPIQQGYTMGYYDEIIGFMRNLFSGAFKDNPDMSFGFLTGILRIAKESIFSGLNNLIENSVFSEHYSEYFGFTESEVKRMLRYYNVENKYDDVRKWYDGYMFGSTEIYNPWSVINYINESCEPRAYWQNTGSNEVLRNIISAAPEDTKENLRALFEGKSIVVHIDTAVIYPEIFENPQTVFSFLLIAGYLKVTEKLTGVIGESFCRVAIPNEEIKSIFGKEILASIKNSSIQSSAVSIRQAIISKDPDALKHHLEKYLTQTISYFDADKEGFYHGLMLGLYAIMNNLYVIKSNRESGTGRFDIQMEPLDKANSGVIVELKVLQNPKSEDNVYVSNELKKLASSALLQITEKDYEQELRDRGISSILKFGIAFYKKQTEVAFQ